jgi:TonB family protein
MTRPGVQTIVLVGAFGLSILAGQSTTGVIRSGVFTSPQDIAALESRVLQAPEDLNARMALLQVYLSMTPPAGHDDPARRSMRLQQILYLVEHLPQATASGSRTAYVYGANGPYANAADHEAVRDQWLAAVQEHPKDTAVTLNAVRFLEREDLDDAEQVLRRAVEADSENRELAANLGFLYATEILEPSAAVHAREALEQNSNAIVLAGAATALPNLAKGMIGVRPVDQIFDLASELSARARQLAPDDSDIRGPMPLIQYFVAAQETLESASTPASSNPSRIRVGENVQAFNLIRKTEPQYPEDARKAGISGDVRFSAIIGRDGTVENLQLISGPPLLVDAAIKAAQTWLYKPTLLNGAPVEVVTTTTVSFPPN